MSSESDFIKTVFGLKLRQQRQKKNWSLQDLADKTKLSKSYLNEIENGKKYPKKVADSILEKDIKNINSLKDLENLKDLNISIKDGDSKIEINTKK